MVFSRIRSAILLRPLVPLVALAIIMTSFLHVAGAGSPDRPSQNAQIASLFDDAAPGDAAAHSRADQGLVVPNCAAGSACTPLGVILAETTEIGATCSFWSRSRVPPLSGVAAGAIFHPPKARPSSLT